MKNIIYIDRIKALRAKKIEQTKEKLEYEGYLDEDDYGRVVPTFKWSIIPNDKDENFYGASGWAENFYDLMSKHDVYIDDDDAFTGRWMYFMSKMRPYKYKKSLINEKLLKDIEYYKLDAGIGFDAHFCPDYSILLDLGLGGLIEKINHYKKINNSEEQIEFYDNHIKVIHAIQIWIKKHIDSLNVRIENEIDKKIKSDLIIKRDINYNIISNKPASFREVLQLILWYHLASRTFNRDGAGGQLDTLLIDYYNSDLSNGLIDKDEATYLLSCFLINDPVYWQIGGEDENGNVAQANKQELNNLISNFEKLSKKDIFNWVDKYCKLNTYEISIPGLRDKNLAPDGKTGFIASILFEYNLVKKIKDAGWYEEFKEEVSNKMIEVLQSSLYSDLKENIIFKFSFSPLSYEKHIKTSEGGITGWTYERKSPVINNLRKIPKSVKTTIDDIYQVGQWAYSPAGIPTAILTGWYAFDNINKNKNK